MNQQQKSLKVILIGDVCTDEYCYGRVDRLSPEAPIPVFVPESVEIKQGMAANVADNLEKLGVSVTKYFGQPSIKTRMIDRRSKQHIIRVDRDLVSKPLSTQTEFDQDVDAFVISDYDKGFVSYELVEKIISFGKPVFIDTKKTDLARFQGAFVKINNNEYNRAKTVCDNIIITLGDKGARFNGRVYPAPKLEITDVCGAGDTFLSALCYFYFNAENINRAIELAISAASCTVKHVGVYAPSFEEISWKD
jgi:D-beta-D-heptose 7-phosphate kinase/D-beta-D-heptose 1-phosphate adenosyltransferase